MNHKHRKTQNSYQLNTSLQRLIVNERELMEEEENFERLEFLNSYKYANLIKYFPFVP